MAKQPDPTATQFPTGLPAKQPTSAVAAQITQAYPMFADLLGIPEIAQILENASQATVQATPQQLAAEIYATDWWKNTSEAARQYQVTLLTDPQTAADNAAQTSLQIYNAGKAAGVPLSHDQVIFLTQDALSHNWNASQIQQNVVNNAHLANLNAGSIERNMQTFQATAADYGLPISDAAAYNWGKQVTSGAVTPDAFNAYAQNQAKILYPHLANQIDSGQTVRQLADPYLQIAGQTLGLDPSQMLLTNPKWSAPLLGTPGQNGKPSTGPMSLTEWTSKIMQDPTYGYSQSANGKDAGIQLAQNLADMFGFSSGGGAPAAKGGSTTPNEPVGVSSP